MHQVAMDEFCLAVWCNVNHTNDHIRFKLLCSATNIDHGMCEYDGYLIEITH